MPEKKIQEQLDAQIEAKRVAQVVEVSEAPRLTSEIFERDARETAIVVVNFRDESARLVESSDAPKLTAEVLKTKGKPVKTVEMFFDDQMWQVAVRDGKPLSLEVEHMKLLLEYKDREQDPAAMDERDRVIANLLLGKMMVDPLFSYKGEGEGTPIEDRSSIMIEALCNAYNEVNHPTEDEIYQVTVRRGVPADAFTLLGENFEWYPVGGIAKKYKDMSEDELAAAEARNTTRRRVLVASMIVDPPLLYKKADETEVEAGEASPPDDQDLTTSAEKTEAYPVEDLSERFMETLHEAHRVTNIPAAGLVALQRFRSMGRNRDGQDPNGESVDSNSG